MMRILVNLLLITNCFSQYYFQRETIVDTFYYANEVDIFNNSLPIFNQPPTVIIVKNNKGLKLIRQEKTYFTVSKSGIYDFIINPPPTQKITPGGYAKVSDKRGAGIQFWVDAEPQSLIKGDTLVIVSHLNTTNGYVSISYEDLDYFDSHIAGNMIQDTILQRNIQDSHLMPSIILSNADSLYIISGYHNANGQNKVFYWNTPDTTNKTLINGFGVATYPFPNMNGDTVIVPMRSNLSNRYGRTVYKSYVGDFPDTTYSWVVFDTSDSLWSCNLIFTLHDGADSYTVGVIRDEPRDKYGWIEAGDTTLSCNLYFVHFSEYHDRIFNLIDEEFTDSTTMNAKQLDDNFKVLDTDTFMLRVRDIYKYGDKIYVTFGWEDSTEVRFNSWMGIFDLTNNTFTKTKTNLWSELRLAPSQLYVDDSYVYIFGHYEQSGGDFTGIQHIYRASINDLSIFTDIATYNIFGDSPGGKVYKFGSDIYWLVQGEGGQIETNDPGYVVLFRNGNIK